MDIKKFLSIQEKIAGIVISDCKISVAFLKSLPKKEGGWIVIEKLKEIELSEGIIEQGIIKNKDALIIAFEKLLSDLYQTKKKISKLTSAILSLPSQKIYSQLFDFPDRMTYDRLEESMKLTVGFSLPLKVEDCYLDWEMISPTEKKVFLALIKKEIVDSYLEIFEKLPILPIACEFYLLSLNRIISPLEEPPFCLVFLDSQGAEVGICKEKTLRFVRTLHWKDHLFSKTNDFGAKREMVEELVLKAIDFYQTDKTDNGLVEKIYLIGESSEVLPLVNSLREKTEKEVIVPKIPFEIETPPQIKKIKSEISELTNLQIQKKKEFGDFEEKNKKEITEIKNKLAELKGQKEKEIKELADLEKEEERVLMVDIKKETTKKKERLEELKKQKITKIKEFPSLEKQKIAKINDLKKQVQKTNEEIKIKTDELKKQKENTASLGVGPKKETPRTDSLKEKLKKLKTELDELKRQKEKFLSR